MRAGQGWQGRARAEGERRDGLDGRGGREAEEAEEAEEGTGDDGRGEQWRVKVWQGRAGEAMVG